MAEDLAWMTTVDVAELLKVHHKTVQLWAKQGCPCLRMGKSNRLRFKLRDVEDWLADRAAGTRGTKTC